MNRSARKSIERALKATRGWVLVYVDKETDNIALAHDVKWLTSSKDHAHVCAVSLVNSLAPLIQRVNERKKDAVWGGVAKTVDNAGAPGRQGPFCPAPRRPAGRTLRPYPAPSSRITRLHASKGSAS